MAWVLIHLIEYGRVTVVLPHPPPYPGDDLALGELAYQAPGCDWQLYADGRVHIQVILIPGLNAEGERPFSYLAKKHLTAQWPAPPTPSLPE